jgi:hypothetical protein
LSKIRGDIRSSRCTAGVVDTGGKWKKSSIRKVFNISFGHLLGSRVSVWINFFLQKPVELVANFAAGVVDTGSN